MLNKRQQSDSVNYHAICSLRSCAGRYVDILMMHKLFRKPKVLMILLLPLFLMNLTQASEYSTPFEFWPLYNAKIESNYNSQYESILRINGLENTPLHEKVIAGTLGFTAGGYLGYLLFVELSKCEESKKEGSCIGAYGLGYSVGGLIGAYYGLKIVALPHQNSIKLSYNF